MLYLYRQSCYSTPIQAYTAMAADCPVTTSNGDSISCQPNATGYEITRFDGVNTVIFQATPSLAECVPDVVQTLELTGLLTLLLVVAWGVQMTKRPIR